MIGIGLNQHFLSKCKLKPGYAYAWDGAEWEIIIVSQGVCDTANPATYEEIDGTRCVTFTCPDGKRFAQTVTACQP